MKQREHPQKAALRLKSPVKPGSTAQKENVAVASPQPQSSSSRATVDNERVFGSFDEDDAEALMKNGAGILETRPEDVASAWESWARDCPTVSISNSVIIAHFG